MMKLFAGAVFVLAVVACSPSGESRTESVKTRRVTYMVDGIGEASITFMNADGGISQRDERLPWNTEYRVRPGMPVSISAQIKERAASIGARIFVDGQLFKESQSKGDYVIAMANGIVPE